MVGTKNTHWKKEGNKNLSAYLNKQNKKRLTVIKDLIQKILALKESQQ